MLVKLYDLPPLEPALAKPRKTGIDIRRSITPEKHIVIEWIKTHFSDFWASEADAAYARDPVSCFVAVENETLIGFACYDVTKRGFFGPTGVGEAARGRGAGKALFLVCLHDMWAQGYGYGIIGAAGPVEFYQKTVNAVVIEDSWPGVYRGMLRT